MIRAVGYDSRTNLLEVVFKDGEVYHFKDVPMSKYLDLMRAPSKGRYMHAHVLQSFSNHEVKGDRCAGCDSERFYDQSDA